MGMKVSTMLDAKRTKRTVGTPDMATVAMEIT
jgi:hypothetical protein